MPGLVVDVVTFTKSHPAALSMVALGAILSLSIAADVLAARTSLPRVSLLVLLGVLIAVVDQFWLGGTGGIMLNGLTEPLIELALVMVAFLLGSELTIARLRRTGWLITVISLAVLVCSVLLVGAGLWLLGFPLALAIALAAISVATDPAAVRETVHGRHDTRLAARVLLGIVAIDDGWGILVFGLAMAVLGWLSSGHGELVLLHALWELGGAVLMGLLIGFPAAWLTGRLAPGEPTQVEAIALILLLAGCSAGLGVSPLLAAMTAGTVIANVSAHHTRSFRAIEQIEWPFLVFFFVLSGAMIDLYRLNDALWLTLAYVGLRLLGRWLGGWLGIWLASPARRAKLPASMGLALTPQAGMAIGMALLAAEQLPQHGAVLLSAVVSSTILFELVGPVLIRRVLK
ncbi:NhaP-type Na+/H+ or K+/H+ antiporter [Oceanisphaera litoralis]|uniref:cation:proton antiporter n=1 Tax=Oceanisphaera litoralis TaxID=225144 RepID=UPI001EF82634|nr:cation:proton antiporter [Oceanisphaera litoralis]MBM7457151.1 NhaP-type Na+/H+ or K+/H+ antiporter [Oceanisphaera litoralis]